MKALGLLTAFFLSAIAAAHAQATDFPNKPVTIVVSLAAGGPSDTVCRILAEELSKIWKQQVVVENKPGGGTVVGNSYVARSKPDGYTWLHASASFLISPAIRSNLPYDALKDFTGISVIVDAPLAIVAHPGFAPNTLQELIEEAKKQTADKPLPYASSGIASSSHMAGELLQKKTGIRLKHIVYSGEAANISDTLAGRVAFQIGTWSTQRTYVEQGKLKLISVIYRTRIPEAPNMPTLHDFIPGLGGALDVFNSIVVPAGVPDDVRAKIADGIKQATATESYRERIRASGSYPRYTTPQETDRFFKTEAAFWVDFAKETGIRLD